MNQANYFCQTLQHLRAYEEVLLFANLLQFSEEEQGEAIGFLAKEYAEEALHYPYEAPAFDGAAALWAARTVYMAAQLLLYRENKVAELEALLPAYPHTIGPSAVLSADLTLRFLPDILLQLKAIDPEDALIDVLEAHLKAWHYSGVCYPLPADKLDVTFLTGSPCLFQLYVDRIIFYKNRLLARHPVLESGVKAALGMYAATFWSDFTEKRITEHERN